MPNVQKWLYFIRRTTRDTTTNLQIVLNTWTCTYNLEKNGLHTVCISSKATKKKKQKKKTVQMFLPKNIFKHQKILWSYPLLEISDQFQIGGQFIWMGFVASPFVLTLEA